MATFNEVGPGKPVTESSRVDKLTPRSRLTHNLRAIIVIVIAIVILIPIFVMINTAFKTRPEVVAVPPKVIYTPTLEGFVLLLTERAIASPATLEQLQAAADVGELGLFDRIALFSGQEITGPSQYVTRLRNSVIIAGLSTIASVVLAVFAGYAWSRCRCLSCTRRWSCTTRISA
jgi:multiple sugar transport system permease protein